MTKWRGVKFREVETESKTKQPCGKKELCCLSIKNVLFKHKNNENNCKWASFSTFLSDSKVKVVKMKRLRTFFTSIVLGKITSAASEHTVKSHETGKHI